MSEDSSWFAVDKTQRLRPLSDDELFAGEAEDDLAGTQRISIEKMPIPTETVRIKFKPKPLDPIAIIAPRPKRWPWIGAAVVGAIIALVAMGCAF